MKRIESRVFGKMPDGREVILYTLYGVGGMSVSVMNLGGTVVKMNVPDREGRLGDVVCGYDCVEDYLNADGYQGALIGRICNRIGNSTFNLNGNTYDLYRNDGKNHLHGGKVGFNHKLWDVEPVDGEEPKLVLTLTSPDGEENYPGTLQVTVTYTLTRENGLCIHYEAVTDKDTIVNLTNHAYFNLRGYAGGSVMDTELQIDADTYLRADGELIPTGEIVPVDGTPFDFRRAKAIGRDFDLSVPDMKLAGGYDHCFNFVNGTDKKFAVRAIAYDKTTGRELKVLTDQPCIQLYTANFMSNPKYPFKGGLPQEKQHAFCLETQKMPDSIHYSHFTDCVLHPGQKYDYTTEYRFSVK